MGLRSAAADLIEFDLGLFSAMLWTVDLMPTVAGKAAASVCRHTAFVLIFCGRRYVQCD
jgi:hypothetical protein